MDTNTGTFTLQAPSEGTKSFLEQDRLEIDQSPNRDAIQSIESSLESLEDDFWNEEKMGEFCVAEGNFENTLEVSYDPKAHPIVSFPALILRKRTERGYIQAYSTIFEQLRLENNQVPKGIHHVVETLAEDYPDTYEDQQCFPDSQSIDANYEVQEVYFPKPANEAQIRIVETLNRQEGVIVQGPPRTGKSHTIANLITHLLTSGQKILVTSQTPRALKVVKEKLSDEIQALCVNLLGSDDGAFRISRKWFKGLLNIVIAFKGDWTEEMERRNLICGDAYALQGDEREVIFLSLVASPGETTMRALASEKDKRRFNVAASRSRDQLWLFHSANLNDIKNQNCERSFNYFYIIYGGAHE